MKKTWMRTLLVVSAALTTACIATLIIACGSHSPQSTASLATFADPLFTATVPEAWTSASQTLPTGSPNDPIRVVTFSIPADQVPVLYVYVYPHSANVMDQSDEPPGFLGTSGNYDLYYQIRTAPEDQSALTPLGLTPAQFQTQLLSVTKSLKAN